MSVTIEGANIQPRWVCDGCGRSFTEAYVRKHVLTCARNPVAKRCGSCVNKINDDGAGFDCAAGVKLATRGTQSNEWDYQESTEYCRPGCPEWAPIGGVS